MSAHPPAPNGAPAAATRPGAGGPTEPVLVSGPALERRALLLLALLVVLLVGTALYLLHARGVFEPTQRLVLKADDAEGVLVGMDLTFSGFPVGRVSRITLADDGRARIHVDVPRKDARWLRTSSVFTLSRGLVGGTAIRAYSGILTDPPLPDGAERTVLIGDAAAEIPKLMGSVRELMENFTALTAQDSPLAQTLAHMQSLTAKLDGPGGAMNLVTGDAAQARRLAERVAATVERTNTLIGQAGALVQRLDATVARADAQVLGPQGLMADTQASVRQLRALLTDARGTLQAVDKLLAEAQAIAGNARSATTDLDALRAEVEASLRKVQQLVNEVNRRWPFARETEIRLP